MRDISEGRASGPSQVRGVSSPPTQIHPGEHIGRQLISSNHFNKQKQPLYGAFYYPGHSNLSVDRLDHGSLSFLTAVGEQNAKSRGPGRSFYGWARLTAEEASRDGRKVEADPIPHTNPFHALIHLASDTITDQDRKAVAIELARISRFVPPEPK